MKRKFFTLLTMALAIGGSSAYAQCPQEGESVTGQVADKGFYYLRATQLATAPAADGDKYFAVSPVKADSIILVDSATAVASKNAIWQVNTINNQTYSFVSQSGTTFALPISSTVVANEFSWNFGQVAGTNDVKLVYTNNLKSYQVGVTAGDTVKMDLTGLQGVNVYATVPGWTKFTATELNAFYSDYFQIKCNSSTSTSAQALQSVAALTSKFHATQVGADSTKYYLNVLGDSTYLNVDTVPYSNMSLYDPTKQIGGLTLDVDTMKSMTDSLRFQFTIWKQIVSDSLAIQTYGIPYTNAKGDSYASGKDSLIAPDSIAWITLASFENGPSVLTAAAGCFSESMKNPQFSMIQGTGTQVAAGYYWITNLAGQMYAAKLNNQLDTEEFAWVAANEGKEYVAAAQWYVPTTSYYPNIFNRESTIRAAVNNSAQSVKFYTVLDANGNVIPNTFQLVGGTLDVDTIVMTPIPAAVTEDVYLGYKRFAESAAAEKIASTQFKFNSKLIPAGYAYISTADSLLSVSSTITAEEGVSYNMMAVDTFSIGADVLRAISYKFFVPQANKDTLWLASYNQTVGVDTTQMTNTTVKANAAEFLIRATYPIAGISDAPLYQILAVNSDSTALNEPVLVADTARQNAVLSGTTRPGFIRPLANQATVISSTAEMATNLDLNYFNGLWSFDNALAPEYATLTPAPAHYTFTSSQNVDLAISMNNANAATLKGTSDLKADTYTEDNFKLFVQCVDADTVKPLYTISTQQAEGLEGDTALFLNAVPYIGGYTTALAQDSLGFGKAVLNATNDTLTINGKKVAVADTLEYAFAFRKTASANTYIIESGNGAFLAQYNGVLVGFTALDQALPFVVKPTSTPTSNEGVTVSEVTVIAGQGNVTIAGAAGKKVVISNIIGQVVANTVLSSDNAVVAAPQGVVVVAVEGEAAVKAIVK